MQPNQTQLKLMLDAVTNHKQSVKMSKSWQVLHRELQIGQPERSGEMRLSDIDRKVMRGMLKDHGLSPGESIEQRANQTRIEVSANTLHEKTISRPVREPFVELREIHVDGPIKNEFEGVHIDLAVQRNYDFIITVENFDVFVAWSPDVSLLSSFHGKGALVYRGDNIASPKAAASLAKSVNTVIHFGDFDPAGVWIASKAPRVQFIIVPKISESLAEHSNRAKYFEQANQHASIGSIEKTSIKDHLSIMRNDELAITQERMLAFNLELECWPFNSTSS